jgi:hypothetical protein
MRRQLLACALFAALGAPQPNDESEPAFRLRIDAAKASRKEPDSSA